MRDLNELFKTLDLKPNDVGVYEHALTHPSFNADANTKHSDYERFEYMGDAVLDYVAADLIFKSFPDMEPGRMSKLRSYLVKSHSLSNYARNIELYDFVKVGNSLSSVHIKQSDRILEDAFEALVGAIYLDKGIEYVYEFLKRVLLDDVLRFGTEDLTDYKSKLQEDMQAEHRSSVTYVVTKEIGPSHDKTYFVNVLYEGIVLGSGSGKSKKAAEEDAAKNALQKGRR